MAFEHLLSCARRLEKVSPHRRVVAVVPTRLLWRIYDPFLSGGLDRRFRNMIRIGKGESRVGCSMYIGNYWAPISVASFSSMVVNVASSGVSLRDEDAMITE